MIAEFRDSIVFRVMTNDGASLRIIRFICVLFVAASAMVAPARAQQLLAEMPFRYDYDGWLTVSVTVNGAGPYDFIVDSGATLTVVFENLADFQEFPFVEGENRRILGLIETSELPPRYIGDLEIAGQTIDTLTSVVVEDWMAPRRTPQGVLGLDFLSQYAVHVDPATMTIRLYDRAPEIGNSRKWSKVRMERRIFKKGSQPLYTVDARIRSRHYPFILDLGASGTVINYTALRDMVRSRRVTVRPSVPSRLVPTVQDLFGNEAESRLVRIQRMRIGKTTWRNRIVSVYNAQVFTELNIQDQAFGLLGADLMNGRPFILDFPERRLYLGPEIDD